MTRTNQLQYQHQWLLQFPIRLQFLFHLLLIGLVLVPAIVALPQDFLIEATQLNEAPTSPALNDPSDLSVGLNLFPVSNLIAAAANAEPPAPIQFVRIAMNSGL